MIRQCVVMNEICSLGTLLPDQGDCHAAIAARNDGSVFLYRNTQEHKNMFVIASEAKQSPVSCNKHG